MDCPQCHSAMEEGYLAFYEPTPISRLVWQAERPGYVRLRRPPGSVVVVRPPLLGRGDLVAFICRQCRSVTVGTISRTRRCGTRQTSRTDRVSCGRAHAAHATIDPSLTVKCNTTMH